MIVITGATGNVGKEVVRILADRDEDFVAISRNIEKAKEDFPSGVKWCYANFDDENSIEHALEGANTLVLITPASEQMESQQIQLVNSAKKAGVSKIVKLSGLGAGPEALIRLPKAHFAIEQEIIKLEIPYVFVRPNLFMQVFEDAVQEDGKIYAPAGNAKISLTDTHDIAELMVSAALGETKQKVIEVTGPEAFSYAEVALQITKKTGTPVDYVAVSPDVAKDSMLSMGMSDWLVNAFLELFDIYRDGHGEVVLDEPFRTILKREAGTLKKFVGQSFSHI